MSINWKSSKTWIFIGSILIVIILMLSVVNLVQASKHKKEVIMLEEATSAKQTIIDEYEVDIDAYEADIISLEEKLQEAEPWFELKESERKEQLAEQKEKEEAAAAKLEKEKAAAKKIKDEEEAAAKKEKEAQEAEAKKKEEAKAAKKKKQQEHEERMGYETGITYDQLARNPDDYLGELVKFKGKVIQVMEGEDTIQIRFAVNDNYDNIILAEYESSIVKSRVLEDDKITIMAVSMGLFTYESTMGGNITIPSVIVEKIE